MIVSQLKKFLQDKEDNLKVFFTTWEQDSEEELYLAEIQYGIEIEVEDPNTDSEYDAIVLVKDE